MAAKGQLWQDDWWQCMGKGSCGRWNFAGNQRCYGCGKHCAQWEPPQALHPQPKGAWGGGWGAWKKNRVAAAKPDGDAAAAAVAGAAAGQPSTIQLLANSIAGIKASGFAADSDVVVGLEAKLEGLKQHKRGQKSHWQQARDSETMLMRKRRLLERTEAARQDELLDIEARKAKVLDMDQRITSLRSEVEKLEAEAAGGIPQPILEAMGMSVIPKHVLDLAEGRNIVDQISQAIKALAELAKPPPSAETQGGGTDQAAPHEAASLGDGDGEVGDKRKRDEDAIFMEVDAAEAEKLLSDSLGAEAGLSPEQLKKAAEHISKDFARRMEAAREAERQKGNSGRSHPYAAPGPAASAPDAADAANTAADGAEERG